MIRENLKINPVISISGIGQIKNPDNNNNNNNPDNNNKPD
jgi:hypothetical protein